MLDGTSEDHDQVDPAESLMREVGAQLRQVRLERGEDLDDVAQYLRIKSTYLFGIEQGDLSVMPGRTYALGFLRSYADYLGFDGEDLITRIKSTVEDLTDRTRLRIRTPLPENRLPKTPLVIMSLAIVAGIYAGWSYLNRSSRMTLETVAEVPSSLRERASEVLPQDVTRDGAVARPPGEGEAAPSAAAPERSAGPPHADPSGARAAAEAPASTAPEADSAGGNVASTADPAPRGPVAGSTRAPAAPPVAEQPVAGPPQAAPEQLAAPQAGPPAEAADELAEEGDPDALTVQPAAGREPTGRAAAPRAARPDAEEAGPTLPSSEGATMERGDIVAGGAAPESEVAVGAPPGALALLDPGTRGALSLLDPSTGGADAPQIYEAVNADARVILRARGRTWIRVSSPSGNYLRSRTLEPGEIFLVPNRPDLELWTGNAGGLEVLVDGAAIVPLGEEGAVVRSVSLDPERLLAAADERP
jgi:cytoskeleton protein RodZ